MDCVHVSASISSQKENGTWTGIVGELLRNETDIATGLIEVEKMPVVHFSVPFAYDELKFMIGKPREVTKAFIIVLPFSHTLWIGIFVSLAVGAPILYLVALGEYKMKLSRLFKFHRIVWMLSVTYSGQSDPAEQKLGKSSRWMVSAWWIAVSIIIATYGGMLKSFATHPGKEFVPLTSTELEKAVRKNQYVVGTFKDSPMYNIIMNADSGLMRTFKKSINDHPEQTSENLIELFHSVANSKFALIMFKIGLEMYGPMVIPGEYMLSEDDLKLCPLSVITRKDFLHKRAVDKITTAMFENGLLKKWKKDYLSKLNITPKKRNPRRSLSVYDMQGAFYLLFLGYICGTFCLIIEKILYCRRKKLKNKKRHLKIRCENCGGHLCSTTGATSYDKSCFYQRKKSIIIP